MKTILIVDDDSDLRSLLKKTIEARGITVLEAGSAALAREILSNNDICLAIVDGLLPDESGVDFIAELRNHNPTVALIFVSAHFRDLKTFTRLVGELNVALVLYKPLDAIEISLEVQQLIGGRVMEPKALAPAAEPPPAVPTEDSEMDAALAEICRDFRRRLPAKLSELEQAIASAGKDIHHLEQARTLAHRLHGSAGSYGFHEVGEAIGRIDEILSSPAFQPEPVLLQYLSSRLGGVQNSLLTSGQDESPALCLALGQPVLLIVDDDEDFLALARGISAKLEVPILTALDRAKAIALADEHVLLGAVVDVHLGQDQGFQLARDIRDSKANGEVPIAFASVDHSIDTRVSAMEAGGTRFFDKPITEESLSQLVQQFVNLSQQRQNRVLIVDDDPVVVAVYTRILRSADLYVESLTCADQLVEKLETSRPDLLILDIELPRLSGLNICRALRMSDQWDLLPILIVSARVDAERRVQAFQAGASDVLTKPLVAEELLARVRVQLDRARLLREKTDRDSLSGLLLRRAFLDACNRAMASCVRATTPLSIALLDIDRFKSINDQHGHSAGDRVIARLGELLRRRFRTEDLRCRWGGEEFLLAFPGQTSEFAQLAAGKLLREFSRLSFDSDEGARFQVTFTAGVAAFPKDGATLVSLVRHADALLYQGKQAGRNQVRC